jgi:hypothetical protein
LRVRALVGAAVALLLVVGFVIFGRAPASEPAKGAQTDAGAPSPLVNAAPDDSAGGVVDLDSPPTAAPRATRGIPRRRPLAVPATPRAAPGSPAASAKQVAPTSPSGPSIARTPGF